MNPLLAHHPTQLALDSQRAFLAEAAAARLTRQIRPRATAHSAFRRLRALLATALHTVATLLEHTVAAAPRVVAL
ncbi:MAG TPA: hypothetical protein VFN74_20825 [Chloroflexota bacterium]|nr:hypothetical protein [Chloroflexota bacterium]